MREPRYVGIDAGGSHTVCVVGDAAGTLGRGSAGSGNPTLVGVDGFRDAVATAARAALGELPAAPIQRAWLGVAGSGQPALRAQLRAAAAGVLGTEDVEISHDARLLLAAADVEHGIGLVAGTGSSAYGLGPDGREVSVGGWGHVLGDEGSGYDIAVRALRAVTAAIDGRGPQTQLVDLLSARLGVDDPRDLRQRCDPAPPVAELAGLAESVLAAAEGDAVAASIVDGAADQLMRLVDACADRLSEAAPHDREPMPVVLAGGLLSSGSAMHRRLLISLEVAARTYRPITPIREPAVGGLALARAGPREPPSSTTASDSVRQPGIEERNS